MKKIFTAAALLFILSDSFSQKCFEKGNNVLSVDFGLGIYRTDAVDKSKNPYQTESDTGGAWLFNASYEKGVLDWLGLGGKINYSSYLVKDSSAESARGLDVVLLARAHAVRTRRIDLYAGLEFGYSHLTYKTNDVNNGTAKGGGTYFAFNLNGRIYFNDFWGVHVYYSFDNIHYPNGTITADNVNPYHFEFTAKSYFDMGIGVMFRF